MTMDLSDSTHLTFTIEVLAPVPSHVYCTKRSHRRKSLTNVLKPMKVALAESPGPFGTPGPFGGGEGGPFRTGAGGGAPLRPALVPTWAVTAQARHEAIIHLMVDPSQECEHTVTSTCEGFVEKCEHTVTAVRSLWGKSVICAVAVLLSVGWLPLNASHPRTHIK